MSIRTRFAAGILFAVLAMACAPAAWAATTPQEVEAAIKKAVDHLYGKQNAQGNWEQVPQPVGGDKSSVKGKQWGGPTAIATYALLAAGESHQDPRLVKAIDFLKSADIEGTYALGLRAQVWAHIPPAQARDNAKRDYGLLAALMKTGADSRGRYSYYADGNDNWDHSCSNYGVLGMWAVSQVYPEVKDGIWQAYDNAWRADQQADGGWGYNREKRNSTLSMTSAGVATLFITQDMLRSMQGINCTGNIKDEHIEKGLKWLADNFARTKGKDWKYYALYNVERVGVASGYKYFGTVDWYRDGAADLVKSQEKDGSWGKEIHDTCYGVLFLSRGRAPVMMNKLDYAVNTNGDRPRPGTWNQRPRDVANLARWTGKQIERDLNWQIVNLSAGADDLHDAPILYISGKDALNFTQNEEDKLKQFIDQGGLILGNADCANDAFAKSFTKLGAKLFGYEFRNLPADHPIFTAEQYKATAWRNPPTILGLSNGARELMLLYPTSDPAKGWQTGSFSGPEREPLVQSAANIFLYAIDKQNLRDKGDTYIIEPKGTAKATIKVARLQHTGNWNPEPGGWRRLSAALTDLAQTGLDVHEIKPGEGKLTRDFPIAHITGTIRFTFDEKARQEIRKYVADGGTLVIDSCGGSSAFTQAAEAELKSIFVDVNGALTAIPVTHPLFSASHKIENVEYRAFARRMLGSTNVPRLKGITIDGRLAVIFSGEDLSVGLVGQPVDGIVGYIPNASTDSTGKKRFGATEIMSNIVMFVAGKAQAAAAEPAAGDTKKPVEKKEPAKKAPEKKDAKTGEGTRKK